MNEKSMIDHQLPMGGKLSWRQGFERYVGSSPRWIGGVVFSLLRRTKYAAAAASLDILSVADEAVPVLGQLDDIPAALLTLYAVAKITHDVNRCRDPLYVPPVFKKAR